MIEGFVNEDLEPVIEVGLVAEDRVERTFAIIDTGFNGYLCLAESFIDKMDLSYIGTDFFELGNGEIVENDVFSGWIIFDEKECFLYSDALTAGVPEYGFVQRGNLLNGRGAVERGYVFAFEFGVERRGDKIYM